eukprot:gene18299-24759_t
MEAEATCAAMSAQGLVGSCQTKDADALLFGAEVVYKRLHLQIAAPRAAELKRCDMARLRECFGISEGGNRALIATAQLAGGGYEVDEAAITMLTGLRKWAAATLLNPPKSEKLNPDQYAGSDCNVDGAKKLRLQLAGGDYNVDGAKKVGSNIAFRAVRTLLADFDDDTTILEQLAEAIQQGPDLAMLALTNCTGCKSCGHETGCKSCKKVHGKGGCVACGTTTGCIDRAFDVCQCKFHSQEDARWLAKRAVETPGFIENTKEAAITYIDQMKQAHACARGLDSSMLCSFSKDTGSQEAQETDIAWLQTAQVVRKDNSESENEAHQTRGQVPEHREDRHHSTLHQRTDTEGGKEDTEDEDRHRKTATEDKEGHRKTDTESIESLSGHCPSQPLPQPPHAHSPTQSVCSPGKRASSEIGHLQPDALERRQGKRQTPSKALLVEDKVAADASASLQDAFPAEPGLAPSLRPNGKSLCRALFYGDEDVASLQGAKPAAQGATPAVQEALPAGHGAKPAVQEAMPAGHGAMPAWQKAMPAGHITMPAGQKAMPAGQGAMQDLSSSPDAPGHFQCDLWKRLHSGQERVMHVVDCVTPETVTKVYREVAVPKNGVIDKTPASKLPMPARRGVNQFGAMGRDSSTEQIHHTPGSDVVDLVTPLGTQE